MNSLLVATLTSPLVGDAPTLTARQWRAVMPLVESASDADAFAQAAEQCLAQEERSAVLARLDMVDQCASALDQLSESGIRAVTWLDERYPARLVDRLGSNAPPLLYMAGSLDLFAQPSLGVVGSRDVGDEASRFAEEAARSAAERGLAIVSGGARGIDSIAMLAALREGGSSVAYMADSLARGAKSAALRDAMEDGRVGLASPFIPTAGFNVGNAMARNKLIYAHSEATLVAAVKEGEGGTWAGAVEALQKGLHPVLVRADGSPGAEALVRKGAVAVHTVEEVWHAIAGYQPAQATFEL